MRRLLVIIATILCAQVSGDVVAIDEAEDRDEILPVIPRGFEHSSTNTILGKANDVIASDDNIVIGQSNSVQGKMLATTNYIRTRYYTSASTSSHSIAGSSRHFDPQTNQELSTSNFAAGPMAASTTTTVDDAGAPSVVQIASNTVDSNPQFLPEEAEEEAEGDAVATVHD